MFFMLADVAE